MLRHPCILGDPQQRGTKSEVVPKKGQQNQKWLPQDCLLKGPKQGGNATSPLHSRGSPTPSAGSKIRSGPQQRATKSEVAASRLPSPGPKRVRKCYVTPAFSGPKRGRKCYLTPAISGIPNKAEQNQKWSPTKGNKYRSGCLILPSRWPKRGRKCYITPPLSGIPNAKRGELNQDGPQHRGTKSEVAASALPSRGSPTKGNKIRSGPQQRGTKSELAASPLPSRGPKRGRKCYATPAFSGAKKRAEMLPHPCNLGNPQHGGTKSQLAGSPLLVGGPKEGGNAMSPLHSRGWEKVGRGWDRVGRGWERVGTRTSLVAVTKTEKKNAVCQERIQ